MMTRSQTIPEDRGTERQAAELDAMRRMLDVSRGCFSLSIAVCDSPALRDYLIEQIRTTCPDIAVVAAPQQTVDVFGYVIAQSLPLDPVALFLTGLELSISSDAKTHPTLRSLNASRDLWEPRFACPLGLWLPEYAATLLSTEARDFWRYRSHRFEFVSEAAGIVAGMADRYSGDIHVAAELSAEEKQFRIAELEQRITEAGPQPPGTLALHVSVWLKELGFLYLFVGDLDRAEEMLKKSLAIAEKLGRQHGMAVDYGNLGLVYQTRGELDRAEEMQQKSLVLHEKLVRQEGMADNYGNLGLIYWKRGELDRAEEMHQKALAIDEKLGHQEGMANQYANLGSVAKDRGELKRARELWTKARDLYAKIGMPHMVKQVQGWLDGLSQGGATE